MPDNDVLEFATGERRAVVTLNRRHFVRLHGFGRVAFIKQESLLLARIDTVLQQLGTGTILLTPHLPRALRGPGAFAREANILPGLTPARPGCGCVSDWPSHGNTWLASRHD